MNMKKLCWLAALAPSLLAGGCAGGDETDPLNGLEQDTSGMARLASATFTGAVRGLKGEPLVGALVNVNGTTQLTDKAGKYALTVEAAREGYSLTVSLFGFETQSHFLTGGKAETIHTLKPAFVVQIDPTKDTSIINESTGVRVNLKANTLVYPDGKRVSGTVRVALASYQPLTMPGDLTATNLENRTVALESVGAFSVSAVDRENQAVNLDKGATADAFIPLPSQAGKMPDCVFKGSCRAAMWRYAPNTGRWFEQRATNVKFTQSGTLFTMTGGQAFGGGSPDITTNGGLGTWNADIEKTAPACTIVELNSIPPECFPVTLSVNLQNSSGTFVPSSRTVPAGTSFVAIYNTLPNVEQEIGIEFLATVPTYCAGNLRFFSNPGPSTGYPVLTATGGTTRFDSSGPWGGVGFPTDSGGNFIDYSDVLAGDYPCKSTATISSF